jgi:competence protein ComEA
MASKILAPDWEDLVKRVKGVGPRNSIKMSQAGLTVNGQAKPDAPAKAAGAAKSADKKAAKKDAGKEMDKDASKAAPQPDAKAASKPDTKTDSKADVKASSKADLKLDSKADAKVDPKMIDPKLLKKAPDTGAGATR